MVPPAPPNFERTPVFGAEYDDLHRDRLQLYLKQRAPFLSEEVGPERLAVSLGLLGNTGGRLVPTVAGYILFGIKPQIVRPEWGLCAVRFAGSTIADSVVGRADLEGCLPDLLAGAQKFVAEQGRNLPSLINPGELEQEYPEPAIREAVLNALVHRDYRLTGRVTVRLYDDRLEVWSPGGMPVQLSLDHLAQRGGVSFPRNPLLAAAARAMGLMDQIGRGLPTITRVMAEVTTTPARFASSQADFLAVIPSRLPRHGTADGGN